jgi:hypothetical protein
MPCLCDCNRVGRYFEIFKKPPKPRTHSVPMPSDTYQLGWQSRLEDLVLEWGDSFRENTPMNTYAQPAAGAVSKSIKLQRHAGHGVQSLRTERDRQCGVRINKYVLWLQPHALIDTTERCPNQVAETPQPSSRGVSSFILLIPKRIAQEATRFSSSVFC